jgi:S1-C subfamily serine protease
MDLLDVFIILLVLVSAIHGLRLGAAVQVLSYGGAILGLVVGVALVSAFGTHFRSGDARTFASLVMLLLPCVVFWTVGRQIGAHLWRRLQGHRSIARVDALGGAAIAVAGTLVFSWVLASILVDAPVPAVSSEIQGSVILHDVNRVMPPVPTELAALANTLDKDGFPLPVFFASPLSSVKLPPPGVVRAAVLADGRSTVKVISYGCDGGDVVVKGSGFVVDGDLVVTNAHVVAGGTHIVVVDEVEDHVATPIYFNPEYDLAVLKVPGITDPSLTVDPEFVDRSTRAVVLGYPGGGNFNAQPAGVLARLDAKGLDIYNNRETTRYLYELQSLVRQGNSGGPLVEPNGEVIGVVFSRSATDDKIGFALSSPGVLAHIEAAERAPEHLVSTERCIDG